MFTKIIKFFIYMCRNIQIMFMISNYKYLTENIVAESC